MTPEPCPTCGRKPPQSWDPFTEPNPNVRFWDAESDAAFDLTAAAEGMMTLAQMSMVPYPFDEAGESDSTQG